jgi:hypothetical protein
MVHSSEFPDYKAFLRTVRSMLLACYCELFANAIAIVQLKKEFRLFPDFAIATDEIGSEIA